MAALVTSIALVVAVVAAIRASWSP
jgi:hypothetical protein